MVFSALRWINPFIILVAITIGTIQYRKANGGYLTYGKGYVVGFLMSLVSTAFSSIYFALQIKMNPLFLAKIMENAQSNLIKNGVSEQKIINMAQTSRYISPVFWFVESVVVGLIIGALLSLISAAIAMKKKPIAMQGSEGAQA